MPTTALRITENVGLSDIGALRRRTAAAVAEAGAGEDLVSSIRLCVGEALANVVVHAYPEHSGLVDVVVELDGDRILLTVRDEGRGFGGGTDHVGGEGRFGLEIIRRLTHSVVVTSDFGRGTEIRMSFARSAESSATTGAPS